LPESQLIWINTILDIFPMLVAAQLTNADVEVVMQLEDKLMGMRVGYTVAVLVAVMVVLIIAANMVG